MNKRTKSYRWVVSALVFTALSLLVVRTALSDPPTVPREADRQRSDRTLAGKGDDVVLGRPSGGPFVAGNGIVEPADREVLVAGEVSGRVSKIAVREGEQVEAGALLIELEHRIEDAALLGAEADLSVAKAELARVSRGLRAEDVEALVAETEAARSRAELSKSSLERTESLAKGGAATADELDRARRQAVIDERNAAAAEARRRAALTGRQEDVLVSRARVLAAEARRDQAAAARDRLLIRAPASGEILWNKVRPGEYYNTLGSEPLIIMGDTSRLRVRLDVDERDIGKLVVGAKAKVSASAYPAQEFSGTVASVGKRMGRKNVRTDDPVERIDTKILEVVIDLDEKDRLVPGLRVFGYIEAGETPRS